MFGIGGLFFIQRWAFYVRCSTFIFQNNLALMGGWWHSVVGGFRFHRPLSTESSLWDKTLYVPGAFGRSRRFADIRPFPAELRRWSLPDRPRKGRRVGRLSRDYSEPV